MNQHKLLIVKAMGYKYAHLHNQYICTGVANDYVLSVDNPVLCYFKCYCEKCYLDNL